MPSADRRETSLRRRARERELALLAELERKVLWLATWTIHHANHIRPNQDGLKVGGHQASSRLARYGDDGALFLGAAGRRTASRSSRMRPDLPRDPVSVRPPRRATSSSASAAWRRAVLPVAHQGQRRRRFLDRLGGAGRRHHHLRAWCRTMCGPSRWAKGCAGPHGGAGGRRRARRGQCLSRRCSKAGSTGSRCWWVIDYNRQVSTRSRATACSRRSSISSSIWAGRW